MLKDATMEKENYSDNGMIGKHTIARVLIFKVWGSGLSLRSTNYSGVLLNEGSEFC